MTSISARMSSDRAWSRAGAIAAVVSQGAPRRVLSTAMRSALLVAGSVLIGGGVAVTLWTGLGVGPLDVFIGAISGRTGLPLTVTLWGVVGSLLVVATLLGARPGPGTIVSPLIVGPVLETVRAGLDRLGWEPHVVTALALHVGAIGSIGLGSGMLIVSGLGAGTGELLADSASGKAGASPTRVRTGFELTWIVTGVALGGPAGAGTVVVALLIAPAVAAGHRLADRMAVAAHITARSRNAALRRRRTEARERLHV